MLTGIPYAETKKQALKARQAGYQRPAQLIEEDWDGMVEFYNFPKDHWRHLRTTNVVERAGGVMKAGDSIALRPESRSPPTQEAA